MERPWREIPWHVRTAFAVALLAQLAVATIRANNEQPIAALPLPWSASALRAISGDDAVTAAKVGVLWLQSFDVQSGQSVALRDLDYTRLIGWLESIVSLDPHSQYAMQSAARIYGEVADPDRSRAMLEWIYRNYAADPERRWPWLAHAAVLAKHRLHDRELSLKYATALADTPSSYHVPHWARQIHWTLLEDKGELDAVRVLIGGLLDSGQVTDSAERHFLNSMLERLESQQNSADVTEHK